MAVALDLHAFGAELRRWRQRRRYSQLELAGRAVVSQRHLSFLENGRSRPSREMVEHLSIVLDVPLRDRNALFTAAGFATPYSAEPLDGPALTNVRSSLETLVRAHHPFPAYVVDRCWNLLLANDAATTLTGWLLPDGVPPEVGGNVIRLLLHPAGCRSSVVDWSTVASMLVSRLRAELDRSPSDDDLGALVDEVVGYPDVAAPAGLTTGGGPVSMVAEIRLRPVTLGGAELRFHTAVSALVAARDVTLDELRLETLLPADEATAAMLWNRVGVGRSGSGGGGGR